MKKINIIQLALICINIFKYVENSIYLISNSDILHKYRGVKIFFEEIVFYF